MREPVKGLSRLISMTYKLASNESALKEWKKLGHTLQEQFKKKTQGTAGKSPGSGITTPWTQGSV